MTGNGTPADPYVVGTWDEFAQVFQASGEGKQIELGADIIAPDTPVNLTSTIRGISQLDGKGYSIVGLTTNEGNALTFVGINQSYYTLTIKNIAFNNTNCQGTGFIRLPDTHTAILNNVVVNGNIFANSVIEADGYFKSISCGGNIHINSPDFKLINLTSSSSYNRRLSFNKWTVDYGNISLSANNDFLSANIPSDNCEFNIHADSTNSVNFGDVRYCAFYGNGSVKINGRGVNVIEDTLNLDSGSTGNNHILTIADMKNIQLLYDLGFPASGVI
jgi:hypothetical protein